jgi:hypothetical protein
MPIKTCTYSVFKYFIDPILAHSPDCPMKWKDAIIWFAFPVMQAISILPDRFSFYLSFKIVRDECKNGRQLEGGDGRRI